MDSLRALLRRAWETLNQKTVAVVARDAREEENRSGLSKEAFFDKYGFVLLLQAPTAMTGDDRLDPGRVIQTYGPEVTVLGQRLTAASAFVNTRNQAIVRGEPKGDIYAAYIHNDFGTTEADFKATHEAYGNPLGDAPPVAADKERFLKLSFWRPVNMATTVANHPLTLCATFSVALEDVVDIDLFGIAPTGKSIPLRAPKYNANQQWFYYPNMSPTDELIVFKQVDLPYTPPLPEDHPNASTWEFPAVFHTAVDLPGGLDAPPRISAEFRTMISY